MSMNIIEQMNSVCFFLKKNDLFIGCSGSLLLLGLFSSCRGRLLLVVAFLVVERGL